MKKQLRNIALATAIMAAGSAVAQDAPKVLAPAWQQEATTSGAGNVRFGQGFGGKIYYADKNDKVVKVADGKTTEVYVQNDGITGTGLTIDQKGNIVVNCGFSTNSSCANYVLIDTDKNVTSLTIPSDDYTLGKGEGRVDQIGRAIGDFTSAEGGAFYVAPNGSTSVFGVSIVNGEINYDDFGAVSSDPMTAASTTSTMVQPRYTSMAEMYAAYENGVVLSPSDAFRYRQRGSKYISQFDVIDEEAVFAPWVPVLANNFTTDGFDWFELQGKVYVVVNYYATAAQHDNNFQIYSTSDNKVVAVSSLDVHLAPSAQQQISVEKVSETKVNVYTITYAGNIAFCTCTPFEVEATSNVYFNNDATHWDNVYAYAWNKETGVSVAEWPGVEVTDNAALIYSYAIPQGCDRVIFNNGVVGEEGVQTADLVVELGKTYNIASVGEAPFTPEQSDLYVIGDIKGHKWETSYTGAAMTKVADGVYEIASVEFEGNYFAFISTPGANWDEVNKGKRYGALSGDAPIAVGQTLGMAENWNSWKIDAGTYKLTVDLNNMTVNVSTPSAVEVVEAENAPAVYYNLQGVEVENPANGLYIVKRGNKVAKEMVK